MNIKKYDGLCTECNNPTVSYEDFTCPDCNQYEDFTSLIIDSFYRDKKKLNTKILTNMIKKVKLRLAEEAELKNIYYF